MVTVELACKARQLPLAECVKDASMRMDRIDDADASEAAEGGNGRGRPPADLPGSEDSLSRAESRRGALAANEKPASARPETDTSGPEAYAKRLDTPLADGRPTPREFLRGFRPAEGGLPEVGEREAGDYIARYVGERPWLAGAKDCDPVVQRVLAALDLGQGHALERHEGYADDERLQRRVTALEDPAQLDPLKRAAGIDGCRPGDRAHGCGATATAIQDPTAFAVAIACGIRHPDVLHALRTPYARNVRPDKVQVPIEDLLGADGHEYCSGYVLTPVGGSLPAAQDCRTAWLDAKNHPEREPDVSPPRCTPVHSFAGGTIEYLFRATRAKDGYEISTMYVEPSDSALRGG
ncbi:hypothetical protein [Actinoallomurus acaciae]|uniref:Uncharacterized protein n=1 Tax=Actinoallomurus acaciae TaxID=502577 RepID=A0ABV5Y9C1_9ACTN